MSTVNSLPPTILPSTLSSEQTSAATGAQDTSSAQKLDTANLPATQTVLPNSKMAQSPGAALISNANGAPAIDGVTINFSPEDMAATLLALQGKTQDLQMRTAKEGLQVSKKTMADQHKKSMEKLDKWIEKSKSAESKSKISKIFGWIGKIAAVIGTAISTIGLLVATPFTAGATAPLLALSIVGLVGSSMALASAISQQAGGPALEIGGLITKACTPLLKLMGVPEDKLESASRIMAGALGLVTGAVLLDSQLAGNFAAGIVQLSTNNETAALYTGMICTMLTGLAVTAMTTIASGGTGAGKAVSDVTQGIQKVSDMAKTLEQVTTTAKYVNGAVSAANTIANTGVNIAVAVDEHAAATAQVDRQKFSALIVKLQAQMQEDQEQLKKVVQEMQDGYSTVSQMVAAAATSRSQIAANLKPSLA